MNLLQAAAGDWQGMTNIWLARLPSIAEFMSGVDKPEHWKDRPVSGLPGAYAQAAAVLMEKMISLASEEKYVEAGALLPPYLYLRRHHFEMQLKSILRTVAGNSPRWNAATGQSVSPDLFNDDASRTHSLLSLWQRVQPIVAAVWATHTWQLPGVTATDVSKLIEQLHVIDPRGDGARYVRDNHGNLTMLKVNRVDLEHTDRNMLDITEFLWWVRIEVGYMVIDHSKYSTSVDLQDLKEADVILEAYLDEELVAVRSMASR